MTGLTTLHLCTDAFGSYGGIAQYNCDFIGALTRHPAMGRATILPRLAAYSTGALPTGIRQLPPLHARAPYALAALAAALRWRPRVIFSSHLYHGPLASWLARLLGARLVSQLHGDEIWTEIGQPLRRALEHSDLVLTVSEDTRARLLERTKVDPDRVKVIYNTVGEGFLPGDRVAARAAFGLATGDLCVLTVGRLDARAENPGYKGHDRVIRLVAAEHAKGRPVVYLIAGIGDDRMRLEALAQSLGVAQHVRFLGKVPTERLPDLYRAADLFAMPSRGEGFGIVFAEAMACGTPAIGIDIGGAAEALRDGELGTCVPDDQFDAAFPLALDRCRERDEHLAARVRAHFGPDIFERQVHAALDTLTCA